MPDFDPVIIQLKVDADQYRRDLRASAQTFDETAARMELAGARAGAGIRNVISGAVAALTAQQLFQVAKGALDYASSLGEVSQQLGVTTRDLQVFQYAGSQVGLTNDEVRDGLAKLTRTLGEAATGSAKEAKVLQLVGFSLEEIKSGALTAGDAIPRIADFLSKVASPAQRAAIEIELFGRAGQRLDTLLSGGSGAINELRDAAESLGIVLSDDQIQQADATADKLAEVKQVLEANVASTVANNANAIVGLASALGTLTGQVLNFLSSNPQLALSILGGLAGAKMGPIGAGLGAGAGYAIGDKLSTNQADQNNDIAFRRKAYQDAVARFNKILTERRAGTSAETFSAQREARLEATRQRELYRKAEIARRGLKSGPAGPVDTKLADALGNLNAPAAPRARATPRLKSDEQRAQEAEREAERVARDEAQYQDNLGRMRVTLLSVQSQLSGTAEDRYAFETARIAEDRAALVRDLALEKDLSDTKRAELLAAHDRVAGVRTAIAVQERATQIAREAYEAQRLVSDDIQDELRFRGELADTIAERRDLELQLIEARKQAERAYLNSIVAQNPVGSAAARNAQAQLGTLDARYGRQSALALRQNEGPLARYSRSFSDPRTQVEEAVVQRLEEVNDGIADAISDFIGTDDPLIKNLLNILIDQVLMKPIAAALEQARAAGGGGGGGFFGKIAGALVGAFGGKGKKSFNAGAELGSFASGGSLTIAGNAGVDQNMLSMNGQPLARVSRGERLDIVPNGMSRMGSAGGGTVRIIVEEAEGFATRVRTEASGVAIETVRVAAPQIITAARDATLAKAGRPSL